MLPSVSETPVACGMVWNHLKCLCSDAATASEAVAVEPVKGGTSDLNRKAH